MFSLLIQAALQNLLFFALHMDYGGAFPKQLSKAEEAKCIREMESGDFSARNRLIEHNLRLVAYIVRKHYADSGEQEELISIGTIGLIKAAETFDSTKSINFSTYASTCVQNEIKMYFRKANQRKNEVYLSEPIDTDKNGNEITIADIYRDKTDVYEDVNLKIESEKLYLLVNTVLDEREKMIICHRYGLSTSDGKPVKPMTQREVAAALGISRSYVSRIEKKALETLRAEFDGNTNIC